MPNTPPSIADRLIKFKNEMQRMRNFLFCVKCGSTNIDQNFSDQLKCSDCSNISVWDSSRFSVAREGLEESDASAAFQPRLQIVPKIDCGQENIISALLPLLHNLTNMASVTSSDSSKMLQKDIDKLFSDWQAAKTCVDKIIQDMSDKGCSLDQ